MRVISEPIAGVRVIEHPRHGDARGSFTETYNAAALAAVGIDQAFVQDNESVSIRAGTVRGLHLQVAPHAQAKLVRVVHGAVHDVVVDLRPGSRSFGRHCTVVLSDDDDHLLWVPEGFAHGFCTLVGDTTVAYKVTAPRSIAAERAIRWDDPALAIAWPVAPDAVTLSARDAVAPTLHEVEPELRRLEASAFDPRPSS